MANPHASVNYVEPSAYVGKSFSGQSSEYDHLQWAVDDDYERAPRLEDYCVVVNIAMEVIRRDHQVSASQNRNSVYVLSYKTATGADGETTSTVNFMGGTKVNYGSNNEKSINYLTTHYADMYVEDLVDYGTTELIGIKSIDIQYNKSCVPIITMQLTDVRGLSLFQPTELSRTKSYNDVTQLNADSIAQSFFQAFFYMPLPKFTVFIKGFYGKPISYQVACDKFDTQFNSATGSFDVTVRFIGYSYSFLTDISMDALLTAPYSDYGGKQYWEDQIANERFTLPNREGTGKVPMPTLFQACMDMVKLLSSGTSEMQDTTLSDEEKYHAQEISTLTQIKQMYNKWYETLYNICVQKYGKKYCFLFAKGRGQDATYTGILILVNSKTLTNGLSTEYLQYSDEFKKLNGDLYSAIENYNSNGNSSMQLNNVSPDFSDYQRQRLFNAVYVDRYRNIAFNGFNKDTRLSKTDVRDNLFVSKATANNQEEAQRNNELQKKYTLQTIYNNGIDQYIDCYFIGPNYQDVQPKIDALQNDANRSSEDKEAEYKQKQLNNYMYAHMSWYPSVENFTRLMIAHLETYMSMMFDLIDHTQTRTAGSLGVTLGSDGICSDVPAGQEGEHVPPFPRVTEAVYGDDGIVNREDSWVGKYNDGIGFEEVDLINGFFNAAEDINKIYSTTMAEVAAIERENEAIAAAANGMQRSVLNPLTPCDLILNGRIYGDGSDINNTSRGIEVTVQTLFARITLRMFHVLAINGFRAVMADKWMNDEMLAAIGESEAENFYNQIHRLPTVMYDYLNSEEQFSADAIISAVTSSGAAWGDYALFSNNAKNMWLSAYSANKIYLYPIQDYDLSKLNGVRKNIINKNGAVTYTDKVMSQSNLYKNVGIWSLGQSYGCLTTYIGAPLQLPTNISEGAAYQRVSQTMNQVMNEIVKTFADILKCSDSHTPSFCKLPTTSQLSTVTDASFAVDNGMVRVKVPEPNGKGLMGWWPYNGVPKDDSQAMYVTEAMQGSFNTFSLVRSYGVNKKENGEYIYGNDFTYAHYENLPECNENEFVRQYRLTACFICGIDAIDYNALCDYLNAKPLIFNLPRLAVVQLGCMLDMATNGNVCKTVNFTNYAQNMPLPIDVDENTLGKIATYFNSLSPMGRSAYINEFRNCCREINSIVHNISKPLSNNANPHLGRFVSPSILGGGSVYMYKSSNTDIQTLTNTLMKLVSVVALTPNYYKRQQAKDFAVTQAQAKTYLTSFINKFKELYHIGYMLDENNQWIQRAKNPMFTTEDMKRDLYRYLKQCYDKWLPSTKREDWTLESFFNKDSEQNGHTFYFIDSFYNKIGQKLLINPLKLEEKVLALLRYLDVNSMMLGFMADIYAQNKCMLLTIQNFYDLNQQGSLNDMFVPYPYDSLTIPNEYPSFVVVYPYEPSKHLNIPNGDYNNDSFMLNDELDTPIAIRSRPVNKDTYLIPAFGVTYGKQYQHYFKNVNVNTTSPIATQQSIRAKHYILRLANEHSQKSAAAQDLYDIYSTQSYTCSVEMMGCAWVQPMMYFVLLNIPMFRGSYLILDVRHKITPGNMTTTFKGCRMANISNHLVEDIFFGEDELSYRNSTTADRRSELADVDNDCPYKVYPLYEKTTQAAELPQDEIDKGLTAIDELLEREPSFTVAIAAGIAGNLYQESRLDPYSTNGNNSGGLAHWHADYHLFMDMYENKYTTYAHADTGKASGLGNRLIKDLVKQRGYDYQMDFLVNSMRSVKNKGRFKPLSRFFDKNSNQSIGVDEATAIFCNAYEAPGTPMLSKRKSYAAAFYEHHAIGGTLENTTKKKDVNEAFFAAVRKSSNSTPAINVTLKKSMANGYLIIEQSNGKYDKLDKIFDVILNGYYNQFQELVWGYTRNGLKGEPICIMVKPSERPQINKRRVYIGQYNGKGQFDHNGRFTADDKDNVNTDLLTSLCKHYGKEVTTHEVPQIEDVGIYANINIESCNDLMGGSYNNLGEGFNGTVTNACMKKVLSDVSHYTHGGQTYPVGTKGRGWCTYGPATWYGNAGVRMTFWRPDEYSSVDWQQASTNMTNNGFTCVWTGTMEEARQLPESSFRPGDVSILLGNYKSGKPTSHAAMWTGKDWRSDFIQNNIAVYNSGRQGSHSASIWRIKRFQEGVSDCTKKA